MTAVALPTRREEDWRYSDTEALASVWPVSQPIEIHVNAAENAAQQFLQQSAANAVVVRDYRILIEAGGRLDFHLLNIGGELGRVTFNVTLQEGAHFALHAAIIGGEVQTLELVTNVIHAEPNATSAQVVRTIVGGRATGNYLGKIAVEKGAQGTDASQSVKAMLLSRTASVNAKPELEIFADDVQCAHGCAVGELDKQALFYMASRGMDPATAQTLLLKEFVAGVFDSIADEVERERFEAAALEKLAALAEGTA